MNVYIKSFARPFYLDRCIRSVKFNLHGYDRIIVLDDGTLAAHLERIRQRHPDVEIRSSGADDGKFELLRQERFSEIAKNYPSATRFWTQEIGKDGGDYCLVLEDDAWLTRRLHTPALLANFRENDALICKLWWADTHIHAVSGTFACDTGPELQYFTAPSGSPGQATSIWIVAFAFFRRDYWLDTVSAARRLGDERSQFVAATQFSFAHPQAGFAKTATRCVHQGWMVPARSTPEYYERGLRQHVYMDAFNDAWMEGDVELSQGYPYDFSVAYMSEILRKRLSQTDLSIWREWHRREIAYQYD